MAGFGRDVAPIAEARPSATGVPVTLGRTRTVAAGADVPDFDLLRLPRPAARAPWAYVKVAEGCDRICGFCAIPSFRGSQRSRAADDVLAEVDELAEAGRRAAAP